MTEQIAKKIGSRLAIKSVAMGLSIAQILMMLLFSNMNFLEAFFWFLHTNDFYLIYHILIVVTFLFITAYFFGQKAGYDILIKNEEHGYVGFKYGFLTLALATFLGSLVGFFEEGISSIGTNDNPFYDYIFKPMFWVLLIGIFPLLLVGFWFGRKIKKAGDRHLHSL